ncbi:hypothetical protein Q3G72_013353 [Acer saccharum]|nr:hypothetical protein Q3G72_013353 [Acer saccharum]
MKDPHNLTDDKIKRVARMGILSRLLDVRLRMFDEETICRELARVTKIAENTGCNDTLTPKNTTPRWFFDRGQYPSRRSRKSLRVGQESSSHQATTSGSKRKSDAPHHEEKKKKRERSSFGYLPPSKPIIVPNEASYGEGTLGLTISVVTSLQNEMKKGCYLVFVSLAEHRTKKGKRMEEKSLAVNLAPIATFRIHRPKRLTSSNKEGRLEVLTGNEDVSPSRLATSIITTSHGILEVVLDVSVVSAYSD